ncbi:STAS domain-containing protein [Dactylosporangium aurantiacum]|uniref:STAS domain-containing protein n=1 Tax=Dactylosporangium aurantiacum TaxID=35754 RepID=A0A9Q9IPM1_9ACTN|nr:STAS domain-containing protein [Dactylosporangium aurantiacum]MDG6103205.1 STAS domain-containing protein [Dactylosporangium aurantiacum]UWZ57710.1 STAS domain-containing protein [Dactylosporangium aurantiacum]
MTASYTTGGPGPDGTTRLEIAGDLDLATRSALVGHVDRLLEDAAVTGIVIDVSAVEFIDSSCIGALVGCKLNAQKAGRTLHVRGAQGQVDEAFELTGVNAILSGPPAP